VNLSFKAFALAQGFTIPVSAAAVASKLKAVRPVSLRALIGTVGPYPPIFFSALHHRDGRNCSSLE
jgi:hypothetical protein